MSTSVDPRLSDLLAQLRAATGRRRPLRLVGADHPFATDPILHRAGVSSVLCDAIARIATGTVREMRCGGSYGETWRVTWARGGTRARWSGVLDARQRIFSTTATGDDAVLGFALAAIGYVWAMPAIGFDGEWASLLGTLTVEGVSALRPGRLRDIAHIVLDALAVDGFQEAAPDGSDGEPRPWRPRVVRDEGELPALEAPAPRAVRDALAAAPAPRGLASILSSFGRFCACSEEWRRSLRRAPHRHYCGDEAEAGIRALDAGLHIVLEGPAGTGKTCCARDMIAAYHGAGGEAPALSVALETVAAPEDLVGRTAPDGRWVDGPLRRAMRAHDGDGCAIHLSASEPLTPAMRRLLTTVLKAGTDRVLLLPGTPRTTPGPRFRVVLELTTEAPSTESGAVADGAGVAHLRFERATGRRLATILGCLESDTPRLWREHAVWIVDDMEIAVRHEALPRVISVAEVRAWLRLAAGMLRNGFESDWVAAMEAAARGTWGARIAGFAEWWEERVRYHGEALARRATILAEGAPGDDPTPATSMPPERIGLHSWQRLLEVRTTVDRLTQCIHARTHLVLLPDDRPELEGCHGTWVPGSAFCSVGLFPPAETAADALAVVVAVAAHERAHARWSGALPAAAQHPGEDAPEETIAASERYSRCFNALEDMRIERLLDVVAPAYLAPYRVRGNRVLALDETAMLSGDATERLLAIVQDVSRSVLAHSEAAWARAVALGQRSGLPAAVVDEALALCRAAGEAGEARDIVPTLAARLVELVEASA